MTVGRFLSRLSCGVFALYAVDEPARVEAAGAGRGESALERDRIQPGRSSEDPQIFPVRRTHHGPGVIIGEPDDPVITPDERQE
jgi:hypothetical protein